MKFRELLRPARTAFLIGLGVFVIGGICWCSSWFQEPELWVYDHFVWFRSDAKTTDSRIMLVELSERDIDKLDYPLRDGKLAALLEKIESGGPVAIGNDLYRDLPEPRDGSETAILDQTLIKYPNITSIFLYGDEKNPFPIPPPKVLISSPNADPSRYGFNNLTDTEVVRRAFLLIWADKGTTYQSFAFVLAQAFFSSHNINVAQQGDDIVLGKAVIHRFRGNDGGYVHERDAGYQFLQDYHGVQKFEHLSVSEVLSLRDTSIFKDKIVLIGNSADSSNDTFATPKIAPDREPGVEVHAQIVNQLLRAAIDGDKPTSSFGPTFSWLWLALWCVAGVGAGFFIRSHILFAIAAIAGVGLIALIAWLFFLAGYWILVFGPAVIFLATAMLVKAYAATHEQEQRENLKKLFSQHVSPEIVEELWTQRETYLQGGRPKPQKLIVTVLFTDLKNYSTISEKMTPAELIAWINECQGALAQHVAKNGGIVNCYMGDGMMAVFGVPVPRTEEPGMKRDAINAVTCALSMGKEIHEMNARWGREGKPLAGLRVGIYTGEAMAGVLGSDDHLAYSVIGDTVNTASRLESVDKEGVMTSATDECRILVGSLTYQYIKDRFPAKHVGTVNLKGKAATTEVYKVLDPSLAEQQHHLESK